jgi:uncharacterized protein
MNSLILGNADARRIFLHRHLLGDLPQGPAAGDDLLDLISGLGFVQLDSINTVARAHDMILFSRRQRYRPDALKRLYERDGALFEHWTHDAAVIPMAFYPYWELRRQRDADRLRQRYRNWHQHDFEGQFQKVIDQIRETGPVCSADVGKDEARSNSGWWDWHPSKTALEYLWRAGALHVIGRDGFQKRYDLTERVLDAHLCDPSQAPDTQQTIDWCCATALDRLGFATHGELAAFWDHITPAEAKTWVSAELAQGRLEPVEITNADGSTRSAIARPGIGNDLALAQDVPNRLRVLSPFDPALRDRKRAERLFGFHYRVEMFVPEPKRVYGYYVFPILQGDRIIARVDMKAFRDADTLVIRALWPERGVRWGKARHAALEGELSRLIRLAGVSQIKFEDGWLRDPI